LRGVFDLTVVVFGDLMLTVLCRLFQEPAAWTACGPALR
jgi:hypothetical protein